MPGSLGQYPSIQVSRMWQPAVMPAELREHAGRQHAIQYRWWSVLGKKRGRTRKARPPVHDDLVRRDFTTDGPNRV